MKPHANIPKNARDFRFLAALGSVNPSDWRRVARDFSIPEESAEALLRSSASQAFLAWFCKLPHELRQAWGSSYEKPDVWEIPEFE